VDFLYNYADPKAVLTSAMQEEFLRFAASRDSDQLLTAQRRKVNEELLAELRKRVAAMHPALGVELVDAGIVGVHPPPAVAEAYENVGGALMQIPQFKRWAEGIANGTLGMMAGSVWQARQLVEAIKDLPPDAAAGGTAEPNPEVTATRKRVADLVAGAGGEVARIINDAEADRTDRETSILADVAGYRAQLQAFNIAPRLYMAQQYLNTLADVLPPIRKYLVASPTQGKPFIVIFDMKDQAGLFDLSPPVKK
jgi:regulator of protease activity HflC (stomatin/prohibitin superfamily)